MSKTSLILDKINVQTISKALTRVWLQDLFASKSLFIDKGVFVSAANRFVDGRVRALNVALANMLNADGWGKFCYL